MLVYIQSGIGLVNLIRKVYLYFFSICWYLEGRKLLCGMSLEMILIMCYLWNKKTPEFKLRWEASGVCCLGLIARAQSSKAFCLVPYHQYIYFITMPTLGSKLSGTAKSTRTYLPGFLASATEVTREALSQHAIGPPVPCSSQYQILMIPQS